MMMMMVSISWNISCSAQNFGLNKILFFHRRILFWICPCNRLDRYCLITGINNSLSPTPHPIHTNPTPTTSLCFIVSVFVFVFFLLIFY